jgi:hypothetical protein
MSERGVFAVHRGVFNHPFFSREPYTEREAWIWLIAAAAWKPTQVRVGRNIVALERGQLAFSTRFLAGKFGWPQSRIVRFMGRLESNSMVSTLATRGSTQITICNYDKYAFDGNTRGSQTGSPTGSLAVHPRFKEEEDKNLRKKEGLQPALPEGASPGIPSKANAASKPERTKKLQTQWPDGFALDNDMRTFAAERRWHAPRQDREFEKYNQHALQTGRLLKDWVAGWRSWVLKGAEFDGRSTRVAAVPVSAAGAAPIDWNPRVAKFKTNGLWPPPWGPQPGSAGCKAPPDVIARHGFGRIGDAA